MGDTSDIDQGCFSQRTYDLLNQLAASDAEVDAINCSLQQKLQQLQDIDRLDKLDNTSESCFSQRIYELQNQLAASEHELKGEAGENKLMIDEIEKSKGTMTEQ